MPKVQIWGFECSRCYHKWVPREGIEHPATCPSCKSPYWDRPRQNEVKPEHMVRCKWKAQELDGKTVEFKVRRNEQIIKGQGWFSAADLQDGFLQISIRRPMLDNEKDLIKLLQFEAECIETSPRELRFSCVAAR